jgi:hypothetical protein
MVVSLCSLKHPDFQEALKAGNYQDFPAGDRIWRVSFVRDSDHDFDALLPLRNSAVNVSAVAFNWKRSDVREFLSRIEVQSDDPLS